MAIVEIMKNSALKTFDNLAYFLFVQILRIFENGMSNKLMFGFDRYDLPNSIRSIKHERRNLASDFEI